MKHRTAEEFRIYMSKRIVTDKEITKTYNKVYKKLVAIGVPLYENSIKKVGMLNTKSLRVAGITHARPEYNTTTSAFETDYYIGVNKNLLDKKDKLAVEKVMAHELIHTLKGCNNHGKIFKYYANVINKHYPEYKVSRLTDSHDGVEKTRINRAKYVVTCGNCGQKSYYMRNCKTLEEIVNYHCVKCKSRDLKVEKIND